MSRRWICCRSISRLSRLTCAGKEDRAGRRGGTPLDNFGNDLVRFIALAIGRPVIVSGLSSGGVIAAWLSAYAMPGTIRGARYEDPPFFSQRSTPLADRLSARAIGPIFALMSKYLGRSMERWRLGRNARSGQNGASRLAIARDRSDDVWSVRRNSAAPQGIRSGVGASLLGGIGIRGLRPCADAGERQMSGVVHASFPPRG